VITLKWPLARVTHGVAVQVAFQSEGTQTGRAVEGSNVGVCLLVLAQVTFVSKSLGTDVARVRSFFQMQGAVPFKKGFQSEGHRAAGAFEWSFSRVDAVVLLEPGSMWKGLTAVGALVGHPSTAPNTFTAVQSQFFGVSLTLLMIRCNTFISGGVLDILVQCTTFFGFLFIMLLILRMNTIVDAIIEVFSLCIYGLITFIF